MRPTFEKHTNKEQVQLRVPYQFVGMKKLRMQEKQSYKPTGTLLYSDRNTLFDDCIFCLR